MPIKVLSAGGTTAQKCRGTGDIAHHPDPALGDDRSEPSFNSIGMLGCVPWHVGATPLSGLEVPCGQP